MSFSVEKMIVAADNDIDEAIRNLRIQLLNGENLMVNQDGTTFNPADPASMNSVSKGDGFKPVEKAVVAAGNDVSDMITNLRKILAEGDDLEVNQDGTIRNPFDPSSENSVSRGNGFKPVEKAVVAVDEKAVDEKDVVTVEWYQSNPKLQELEIKAMMDIKPDTKWGYMPDGKMYWTIRLQPVVVGKRKDWTFLAIYDSDHPQQRWGGSVKYYPVKPNYGEMLAMLQKAYPGTASVPHTLRDEKNNIYICTQDQDLIHASHEKGGLVTSAASCLRFAMRWVTVFELSLIDPKTWELFQQHGKI